MTRALATVKDQRQGKACTHTTSLTTFHCQGGGKKTFDVVPFNLFDVLLCLAATSVAFVSGSHIWCCCVWQAHAGRGASARARRLFDRKRELSRVQSSELDFVPFDLFKVSLCMAATRWTSRAIAHRPFDRSAEPSRASQKTG